MADPRCTRRRTRRRTSSRRPPRSRRGSLSLAAMIAAMITTMIAGVAPAPTSLSGVPGSGVLGPSRAQAAPAADPMVEARALYDRGAARFETADYAGAIELWTEAYAQVPNTPETAEVKILLLYNLATARERQFEVDGAPIHLRQALILLDGFLDSLDSLGRTPEESAAEREEAETRRAAIEARLAAAIPEPEPEPGPGPTPPPSDPTLTPGPVATARDITDTLRQASHLAEVEALTGVGSWELDLDVGEVLWSKVTHQIHETDPKVFNNQLTDALLFFPPEGRRVLEPALAALMERGTPYDLELPFITATGRHRWVRATSQAEVRDGRVIRTFGTFQDITDTRNATEELRLREERLRLATQAGGVGILDWELTTQKITADTQTLALIGGTGAPKGPKTLDVAAVLRAIHPDDRPRVTAELTTAMAHDDDSFDTQFRYLRADNQWIWLHARGKVLRRSAGGAAARALGTIVDITASQSQQEALVTAKNRLQATMSAIPDILFEIDASDRFVTYHTASPSQLAQPPERFLGRHYRDTLPPEIADTVQQAMYEAAELGRSSPHRYAIILPQGPRWYEVTAARRLPSVRGDPLSFVFLTRDITDRHNTERALEVARQEAEAASAAKSQFLATMSHEIRTPLHGMLGMLGALERGIDGPAARRQLTILRESAEMLMEILNDILDLSKIEAGKLTLEIIPFLPSALVRRVQALHQARAQERGLEFTVYTSPCSDSWRLGDPHRILQILHNLVGNAIKFTARGAVQVAIECEEGTPLYLTVRDTGIGMNPEQQANVFAAFEQADSSITRSYGGTGLGMSIVHRLVRAMDGTLALESSLDRGTTVSITLPLPHTPAPPQNQTPRRDDNPLPTRAELALRGLRILAVDDNPINRLVLQGLLDHLGVEAVLDESGPAAVGRVDREAFDLYLLDISMPELDGVETLCRIRAVEAGLQRRPAPAIAVTAHTYPAEIDRYLAAGFAAHLAKPILRDSLLCALTNALSLTGPATPAT